MINPILIELQIQGEKEERNRYWRKMSAIHEITSASQHLSTQPQMTLSEVWRIIQNTLRLSWSDSIQAPLSIQPSIKTGAPDQ